MRRGTRRLAVIYIVLQVAALAVSLWLTWQFSVASLATTAIAMAPTIPGGFLAGVAYLGDRREGVNVDAKARSLAVAVALDETMQRAQLVGDGAHRIDVTFAHHAEQANNALGAAATGRLNDITAYYRGLRPGRLVITGDPGAGKTLLAVELVLGLLTDPDRSDSEPVPVRFSLTSWNTGLPLSTWLVDQIRTRFRDQGITADDAEALVRQNRVLPVLDGLDEMDRDADPLGGRRSVQAVKQLNALQDPTGSAPLVLTCRTAHYAEIAAVDLSLREAARIRIDPVTPTQARSYLEARVRNPARWQPVVDILHTVPDGTLARALDTPWRLNLAVTVYEEPVPDTLGYVRDPDQLPRLASPSAVRDHLLGLYIPAAMSQHPSKPKRYRPDRAHRWLASLAIHLATPSSAILGSRTDAALHELWPMAGTRRVVNADRLLATLLLLVAGVLAAAPPPNTWAPVKVWVVIAILIVLSPVVIVATLALNTREPRRLYLPRPRDRHIAPGLAAVVLLVCGTVPAVASKGELPTRIHPLVNLVVVINLGLAVLALTVLCSQPVSSVQPTDPRRPLRDDLILGLTASTAFGLVIGLQPGAGHTRGMALAMGLTIGLYGASGAGRRYLVFLCCTHGLLPLRFGSFLHWSYEAGLLRISGLAYEFRHRELQDWLTRHPTP